MLKRSKMFCVLGCSGNTLHLRLGKPYFCRQRCFLMTALKRSIRYLNRIRSCSIALLLVATMFYPWSSLASSQIRTIASGHVISGKVDARTSTSLHQNLVVEGDIVVKSGTYLIENTTLNLTGRITASNDATILIRNATLLLTTLGETVFQDGIVLADRSRLIVQNASIILKSANIPAEPHITVGDEATVNITDSELLSRNAFVISRQNARTYINCSEMGSTVDPGYFGVRTEGNSSAKIQESELHSVVASESSSVFVSDSIIERVFADENGLIEIENSRVKAGVTFVHNSQLRVLNSTIDHISTYGNSTALLTDVSTTRVEVRDSSAVWLIDSNAEEIDVSEQGKVYVGWQLPLLGIIAIPRSWLPILQGIAILAAIVLIIALVVFLNRRWKRRRLQKSEERSQNIIRILMPTFKWIR